MSDMTEWQVSTVTAGESSKQGEGAGVRPPYEMFEDYQVLVRVLTGLQAQQLQAQQDIDTLQEMRNRALAEPKSFVASLVTNPPVFPERQKVIDIPDVDFSKYQNARGTPYPDPVALLSTQSQSHRHLFSNRPPSPVDSSVPNSPVSTTAPSGQESKPTVKVVRGRIADESKPERFNLPWTPEEHARLVELLDVYPEEEVAAQRWEKISKALGDRTPKQVASRTQKYFIKLAKAGLPVPGRMPNLSAYIKPQNKKGGRRPGRPLGTTSFDKPTVYMSDDEGGEVEDVDPELRNSAEYRELLRLTKLRERKRREQVLSGEIVHEGYRCDGCSMEPIIGVRWACTQCLDYDSVDLCAACHDSGWENELHRTHHVMDRHVTPEAPYYVDDDYTSFNEQKGEYNYLDPNFRPGAQY